MKFLLSLLAIVFLGCIHTPPVLAKETEDAFSGVGGAAPPTIPCVRWIPGCKPYVDPDDSLTEQIVDTITSKERADYRQNQIFTRIIPNLLSWLMLLSGSIAILMGVLAGILFVTAGNNDERIDQAKRVIIYSGLGLLLTMFAYFIVEMINRLPFDGAAR